MRRAGLVSLLLLVFGTLSIIADYTNQVTLSPRYTVSWNILQPEGQIELELRVKTRGWIGFGLGEPTSGSMPGSDSVTVEKINSRAVITDRHTLDFVMPEPDTCQDWQLVSYSEDTASGTRIVQLSRKLITNDTQDRPILAGPTRVVWAFGESDTFGYHTSNRGASVITFFNSSNYIPPTYNDTGVVSVEYKFDLTIPTQKNYLHLSIVCLACNR
jgi:hypothetical protein